MHVFCRRDWATFQAERAGSWLDTTCVYKDYCSNQKMLNQADCDKIAETEVVQEHPGAVRMGVIGKKQREDNCWVTEAEGVGSSWPASLPSSTATAPASSNDPQVRLQWLPGEERAASRGTATHPSIYGPFDDDDGRIRRRVSASEHMAGMVYCIMAQVLGTMLFAYVIGVVVDIIMNLDPIDARSNRPKICGSCEGSSYPGRRRDHPQPPLEPAV